MGAALGLTLLVGVPRFTLALLMATLSCDQVLTLRASEAVNLRLAHLCALALLVRLVVQRLNTGKAWRAPLRLKARMRSTRRSSQSSRVTSRTTSP